MPRTLTTKLELYHIVTSGCSTITRTFLLILLCAITTTVLAEQTSTRQQRYDAAFKAMYQDAKNLDKTFNFAELAIEIGDIEGALAALERMLIIDPDLPQIRLRLGALYFQINSYTMAEAYLAEVIKHPDAPSDIIKDAQTMLAKINTLTSTQHLSGTLAIGQRYQSNANNGPGSNEILLFGNTAVLDDQFTQQSDSDVYLTAFTLR